MHPRQGRTATRATNAETCGSSSPSARDEKGVIYTPLREGRGTWPDASFGSDVAELRGVRVRVISIAALEADKSVVHEDPRVAAKDRADLATLDLRPRKS